MSTLRAIFGRSKATSQDPDPFMSLTQAIGEFQKLKSPSIREFKRQLKRILDFRSAIVLDSSTSKDKLIKIAVLDEKIDKYIDKVRPDAHKKLYSSHYENYGIGPSPDKEYDSLVSTFHNHRGGLRELMVYGNYRSLHQELRKQWLVEQLNVYLKQHNLQTEMQLVINPRGYLNQIKTNVENHLKDFLGTIDAFTQSIRGDQSREDIRIKHNRLSAIVAASLDGCIGYFSKRHMVFKAGGESEASKISVERFFLANEVLSYRYLIAERYRLFREQVEQRVIELTYPLGTAAEKARAVTAYEAEGHYRCNGNQNKGGEYCQSIRIRYESRTSRYLDLSQAMQYYFNNRARLAEGERPEDDSGVRFYDELLLDEMIGLQESHLAGELSLDEFTQHKNTLCEMADLLIAEGFKLGRNRAYWLFLSEPGCERIYPKHKANPQGQPCPSASEEVKVEQTEDPLQRARKVVAHLRLLDPHKHIALCNPQQLQHSERLKQSAEAMPSRAPSPVKEREEKKVSTASVRGVLGQWLRVHTHDGHQALPDEEGVELEGSKDQRQSSKKISRKPGYGACD